MANGQGPTLILAQASGAVAAALTCPGMSLHAIRTALLNQPQHLLVECIFDLFAAAARYLFVSRGQAKAKLQNSLRGSHD